MTAIEILIDRLKRVVADPRLTPAVRAAAAKQAEEMAQASARKKGADVRT